MTKGYKTTEFWVTVLSAILIGAQAIADNGILGASADKFLVAGITIVSGVYVLGRSYVKAAKAPNTETETTPVVTGPVS